MNNLTPQAAVIGLGFIGKAHVEALRRLGIPVRGVLGHGVESTRQEAAQLGLRPYLSLDELLAELTGGPVRVIDGGGVWGPGEAVPPENPTVRAELSRLGPVSPERLTAIVKRELPIGVELDLVVPAGTGTGSHQ